MFDVSRLKHFFSGRLVLITSALILLLIMIPVFAWSTAADTGCSVKKDTSPPTGNSDLPEKVKPEDKKPKDTKAIGIEALAKNEYTPVSGTPFGDSAALFIGVNHFTEDDSLAGLKYAVNDAVEQAYVFVKELKLIPPKNCILCISGEPSDPLVNLQLAELRKSGVEITTAAKPKILQSLQLVTRIPSNRSDIVIVSFSTHGFESTEGVYLMPTDGLRRFLGDTAIFSATVRDSILNSSAGKKLLILDACRERVYRTKSSGSAPAMTRRFKKAFAASYGFATLMSCSAGQYSYEDPQSRRGVFTRFLLKALRGKAAPDQRGFVTVGSISQYLSTAVPKWVRRNKPEVSVANIPNPTLSGAEIARNIPLAVGSDLTPSQIEKARQQYLTLLPEQTEANNPPAISLGSGNALVLLNSPRANLRSVLRRGLDNAFNDADVKGVDFIETKQISEQLIEDKLAAARQQGYDTLISCVIETSDQGTREVYGAKMKFYSASVTVKQYDVQTQNVINFTDSSDQRGSRFPAAAENLALTECAKQIGEIISKWITE